MYRAGSVGCWVSRPRHTEIGCFCTGWNLREWREGFFAIAPLGESVDADGDVDGARWFGCSFYWRCARVMLL